MPTTQGRGSRNWFKPLNISPPLGVYEVTGDKEKRKGRLLAAAGTIRAKTITLVKPSPGKRGVKLGL